VLIFVSWVLLLIGLLAFTWFFVIRGRGALRYWIRSFEVEEQCVLGRTFAVDDLAGQRQFFTDGNAVVRSLDRRTNTVLRQWDKKEETMFLGLLMNAAPDEEVPEDYELRSLPRRGVVRLSGTNRIDEDAEVEAVKRYAEEKLVIPLLATWIALTLIGTAQPFLLVLGILLICFLSGACKFVFIHQMTDEADEIHLQNY